MVILPQVNSPKPFIRSLLTAFSCALCLIPFWGFDPLRINYTGLLNTRFALTASCLLLSLCIMSLRFFKAYRHFHCEKSGGPPVSLLLVMVLVLLLIPYRKTEDFWSGLHVLWAWLTFGVLNVLLFRLYPFHPSAFRLYAALTAAAFLAALTTLSVTGVSELLYAFALNLFLDRISFFKE